MKRKEEPDAPDGQKGTDEDVKVEEPTAEELLAVERDRYLRLAAEFDNYRKRADRDMAEFRRRAADNVLLSVLDVVDNLDRALGTTDTCSLEELVTGLRAIRAQMDNLLDREAISPIESVGLAFDPYYMEAVMRIPSDEVEEGHVVSELQRGYRGPHDVLRPSRVVVSSGPKEVPER